MNRLKMKSVAAMCCAAALLWTAPAGAQVPPCTQPPGGLVCGTGGTGQQAFIPRPIPLGVSGGSTSLIAHPGGGKPVCATGTLGSLVEDQNSNQYILSNNHVLAKSNGGLITSRVVQPGLAESINCRKAIGANVARLTEFVPLVFKGAKVNTVDAAIAKVIPDTVCSNGFILNVGVLSSAPPATPILGLAVQKMGRTSCLTTGTISAIGVNVTIGYDNINPHRPIKPANFVNQIAFAPSGSSTALGAPGDSGSLIVTEETPPRAVALLFAVSATSTLGNPIASVLADLKTSKIPCLHFVGGTCPPGAEASSADGEANASPLGIPAAAVTSAKSIRDRHESELMKIPGAIGTGIGIGDAPGTTDIEVYLKEYTPQAQTAAPAALEGVQVKLVETGPFAAY